MAQIGLSIPGNCLYPIPLKQSTTRDFVQFPEVTLSKILTGICIYMTGLKWKKCLKVLHRDVITEVKVLHLSSPTPYIDFQRAHDMFYIFHS